MSIPMGIVVVVASGGRPVPIEWALSIATLSYPVGMHHAWLVNKKAPDNPAFTRAAQREQLAERALALGAEYMMCFDDDTVPPAHAIQSLWYVMSQHPEAGIVGGIYCTKEDIPSPIVFKELGAGPFWQWTLGEIFPCKGLGLGCMLVRMSALKKLPKPWFEDKSDCTIGRTELVGEIMMPIAGDAGTDDLHLCRRMADAGFVIYAHGGVLPEHWDTAAGTSFHLPDDSYPVTSYLERKAKAEAAGTDAKNRESNITQDPGAVVPEKP
jgi:hypothetical protein